MRSGRSILICLTALCAVLLALLFMNDTVYTELTFSEESGFYDEPFQLELYAPPGTEIFYTLDGSEPDENAIRYTNPILIGDATRQDNVYSMRTDVTAGFLSADIAHYNLQDPHYAVPDYPVDKCTVVRGAYRDTDGNFSESKTACYFVGYQEKAGYDNIGIVSVVTAPENLFDYDNGIYVLGRSYDEFASGDRESMWENAIWEFWGANYRQRGYDWEREAEVQMFDTERNLLTSQKCGIRIQGGGSRGYIPRSLNLYAREEYGDGRFYVDLFGTNYMADTVTLFAGGDDRIAKLRDMLTSALVSNRNFATMNYRPYALFLDGEYWGVYFLTEKYDATYLSHRFDVDKDNVVMIKSYGLEEGEEYYDLYTQMTDFMTSADLSDENNYREACNLIDMQSYIDYYATEVYIGRQGDWPGTNEALWRTSEISGDTPSADGRWRWMLFDVNSDALTSDLTASDTIAYVRYKSDMFDNLCQNEEFREQFTITLMDLINENFRTETVDSAISDFTALMTEPMRVHHRRFSGVTDTAPFLDAVADVQNFLDNRSPYMIQYLKSDFALSGVPAPVEITVNDPDGGIVTLNTITPSLDTDGTWQGEYFTDYPVTLTAVANDGYRFVRWESGSLPDGDSTEPGISLSFTEQGLSVRAVFEKIS